MGLSRRQLGDGEQIVLAVRPHVVTLWQPAVVLLALSPAATALLGLIPDGPTQPWLRLVVAALAGWCALRYVLWPFLAWWHTVYAVTSHRVLHREGVLARWGRDVPLGRVDDVTFTRRPAQRLVGSGRLVVSADVEDGALVLENAPRVVDLAQAISEVTHLANRPAREIEACAEPEEGDEPEDGEEPEDREEPEDGEE